MGKMGKTQNGKDQRNADRTQRVDAAHGDAGEEIKITEIGQGFQSTTQKTIGRFRDWQADASAVPVNRLRPSPAHSRDGRWPAPGGHSAPPAGCRCPPCSRQRCGRRSAPSPAATRPAVGSSSSSSLGSVISARPTATIWRWPPGKFARRLSCLFLEDRETEQRPAPSPAPATQASGKRPFPDSRARS